AERDQLGKVVDCLDAADALDPHEPVRVEIVAEEEPGVVIFWREEPRPTEVEEVALVDGLDAERVARLGEGREHGITLLLLKGSQCVRPEPTLRAGLGADGLPDISCRSPQRPRSSGRSPRPRARARGTSP